MFLSNTAEGSSSIPLLKIKIKIKPLLRIQPSCPRWGCLLPLCDAPWDNSSDSAQPCPDTPTAGEIKDNKRYHVLPRSFLLHLREGPAELFHAAGAAGAALAQAAFHTCSSGAQARCSPSGDMVFPLKPDTHQRGSKKGMQHWK